MALLNFRRADTAAGRDPDLAALLAGASIEVMPRTAAKLDRIAGLLAPGSQVYVAHIAGTPIADMVATAARLRAEGMEPIPHFPARLIADHATLRDWIARYRGEADIGAALVLAGGIAQPAGIFSDSMQLLDTGMFADAGISRLHVAGHPEGNRDIDPAGGEARAMAALLWKQEHARSAGAEMTIVTQFAFEVAPVLAWAARLRSAGIGLPVHIGAAGPARLQTMIRFAIACGVGPSLRVLQRRARDVTKLATAFEPTAFLTDLARHKAADPTLAIERVHLFPLGGIVATTDWMRAHGSAPET